ncbi:uncharacterized protein LOC123526293 isoform X1 [Mercenaria mercenaria]|uniref:uncharacterized protein LOC123526293 isoform X1 n=1 Tax=Mercenaria mercenaria TaxID=6596 RepID=UPI00234E77C0|nr:uncharacterized protein LOC123526293 isoform X1 [Mercenaria mercenaria]XP_045161320.2 uncharacterized protein LOC123526293 isoform X1 [Mercenaria mercenaria]
MCSFIKTLKTKGIWIAIICTLFLSPFYVAHQIHFPSISKTFEKLANLNISSMKGKDSLLSTNATGQFHNYSFFKSFNASMNNVYNSTEKILKRAIKIGILVPSSTRKIKNPLVENLSLTTICLPSLYKTMEEEYTYIMYVGIEKGDYLETVKYQLETMFDKVKTVVTRGRTFTKTVNAMAREAYEDGMDYFVRINDDSSMETQKWTSEGISILQNYNPPNIGVVGPTCHEGNTGILTHDMVHRSHLEIFDFYYPPYFDNWWTDDWITKVYSPERSTKLSSWVVKHHLMSHGTRYNVDFKKHIRLNITLTLDHERLSEYLSKMHK